MIQCPGVGAALCRNAGAALAGNNFRPFPAEQMSDCANPTCDAAPQTPRIPPNSVCDARDAERPLEGRAPVSREAQLFPSNPPSLYCFPIFSALCRNAGAALAGNNFRWFPVEHVCPIVPVTPQTPRIPPSSVCDARDAEPPSGGVAAGFPREAQLFPSNPPSLYRLLYRLLSSGGEAAPQRPPAAST